MTTPDDELGRRPLYYILDEYGDPVPMSPGVWTLWHTSPERCRIARDDIGKVRVSTVFLGIDHDPTGPEPLLFESVVFGGEHDGWTERHATREAALAAHKEMVEAVRDYSPPSPPFLPATTVETRLEALERSVEALAKALAVITAKP